MILWYIIWCVCCLTVTRPVPPVEQELLSCWSIFHFFVCILSTIILCRPFSFLQYMVLPSSVYNLAISPPSFAIFKFVWTDQPPVIYLTRDTGSIESLSNHMSVYRWNFLTFQNQLKCMNIRNAWYTKYIIRSRKLKKHKTLNDQKEKGQQYYGANKRLNNTNTKMMVHKDAPKGSIFSIPLVAPILLMQNDTNTIWNGKYLLFKQRQN